MATTGDGVTFGYASAEPFFEPDPNNDFEERGTEDPRITYLNGSYYIVYVGSSVDPARTVLNHETYWRTRLSLAVTNDWERAERKGILFGNYDDKDGALLPELIDGQYYLFHRRMPSIWLSRSADLRTWEDVCDEECRILQPNPSNWDNDRIGVGSPPIACELGWLVFYHGRNRDGTYRIGAFVTDRAHPDEIIFKLPYPLLEPELPFERNGQVPNVVFTCGAVEAGGNYWLYYGGADSSIGGATIPVQDLIAELKQYPVAAKQNTAA